MASHGIYVTINPLCGDGANAFWFLTCQRERSTHHWWSAKSGTQSIMSWYPLICAWNNWCWRVFTGPTYFTHDVFVVIISKCPAELVIVHVRLRLSVSPLASHLVRVDQFEFSVRSLPRYASHVLRIRQQLQQELPQLYLPRTWNEERRKYTCFKAFEMWHHLISVLTKCVVETYSINNKRRNLVSLNMKQACVSIWKVVQRFICSALSIKPPSIEAMIFFY